jgi:predicted nucleotidyltransferase
MALVHVPSQIPMTVDSTALAEICRRYRVQELALFGSILRPDFRPASDVDCVVTFLPDTRLTLFWLGGLTGELEAIFHRPVDLVHQPAIRPFLRDEILSTKETIYVETPPAH